MQTNPERIEIRSSYSGLGQAVAVRAITKARWPDGIDVKFRPAIFSDCYVQCHRWAECYFTTRDFSTSLSEVPPTDNLARLGRITPGWYAEFAKYAEKEIRGKTLPHIVYRRILADPEYCKPVTESRNAPSKKETPSISEAVKSFFGLTHTTKRRVAGEVITVKTSDDLAIQNRVKTGQKQVVAEEILVKKFLEEINDFEAMRDGNLDIEYKQLLERLDPLVFPEEFDPTGLSLTDIRTNRSAFFWEWLREQKSPEVVQLALGHLSQSEIKTIASSAVLQGRTDAVSVLASAFDLNDFWQAGLDAQISWGNVMMAYTLVKAGAKITETEIQSAKYRANPTMLAVLGLRL